MPEIYKKSSSLTSEDLVLFLNALLEKTHGFVRHIDTQVNVLIAITSGVFVFSTSYLASGRILPHFIILGIFSSLSAVVSLFAVHPPRFMRKHGQRESLLYHKTATNFTSGQAYSRALATATKSRRSLLDQYALEIYNMNKFYYEPKRMLFKVARTTLLIGIILSLIAFLVYQ